MEDYIKLYAIMPSSIYKTKQLTPTEKLIAERITTLCKNKGYAWITNKSLADMYGIGEDTVSKSIKKLEKYEFIKCNYNNKNNSNNNLSILSKKDSYDKYLVYDDEIYLDEELEELENLLAPFKDENE